MDSTRRTLLAAVGGATTTGLAGCTGVLGGGGGGSDCDLQEEEPVTSMPNPVMGDDDAPVTVKAWEDFACPHCQTFSLEALPKIEENYVSSGDAKFEHHDFPIPVDDKWSWAVASAARGVQDATDDGTFFEYAHAMFENQGKYSMNVVQNQASEVGADGCSIRGDAKFGTYRPVLEADRQRGSSAGVRGTPAIFVDGQQVDFSGASSFYPPIESAIESALSQG
ncbi:DsbA family protein [Halobium palmae]|uniref:DsbA family protein n=1 Tax=Halobium palmae TaxID=1776492 RepID=A0ABD5S0T8_9EURY